MTYLIEFNDEQRVVLLYVSRQCRFAHMADLIDPDRADQRFRIYDEMILVQDVESMFGRNTGINAAKELVNLHGPDSDYKTVYVVQDDLGFGLTRVFNAYRGREDDAVHVVKQPDEAFQFLDLMDKSVQDQLLMRFQAMAAAFDEELWF